MVQAYKQPAQAEDKLTQWVQSYKDTPAEKRAATIDTFVNDILAFSSDRTKTIVKDQLKDFLIDGGSKLHLNLNRRNADNVASFVNGVLGSDLAKVNSAAEFCNVDAVKEASKAAKAPLRVYSGETMIVVSPSKKEAAQQKASPVPKPVAKGGKEAELVEARKELEHLSGRVTNLGVARDYMLASNNYFSLAAAQGGISKEEFEKRAKQAQTDTLDFLNSNSWLYGFLGEQGKDAVLGMYRFFLEHDVSMEKMAELKTFFSKNQDAMLTVAQNFISNKNSAANENRFLPRDPEKAGVNQDDRLKELTVSTFFASTLYSIDAKFMFAICNYESQMENVQKGSRGPYQITRSSALSETRSANLERLNESGILGAGLSVAEPLGQLNEKFSWVTGNVFSNTVEAADTMAFILLYHPGEFKKMGAALSSGLKTEKISDLKPEQQLNLYKRLSFYYNGNAPIQAEYAGAVYNAMETSKWKSYAIPWMSKFPQLSE